MSGAHHLHEPRGRQTAAEPCSLLCGQDKHVFTELGTSKMGNGLVHGDQGEAALNSETEDVGIGHLLGPVKPREERAAQSLPVSGDRKVVVSGMLGELPQDCRSFAHRDLPWTRRGSVAEKARFGKCANGPLQIGSRVEPIFDQSMMNMASGSERNQDIDIEQVARSLRQAHPRTHL